MKRYELCDAAEAAEILGCSRAWVYELIKNGRLAVGENSILKASVYDYMRNKRPRGRPSGTFRAKKKAA